MALARTQIKKKVAPKTSKKSPKKKTSRTSSSLSKLFSTHKVISFDGLINVLR